MTVIFKNRSGSVLNNCSSTYFVEMEDTNIESRSFTFHATNKSDCDAITERCTYGNSYYSNLIFLRGAKLIADNSSSQMNSIEINITENASVYNGRGVLYDFIPEITSGRNIDDRIFILSFHWLGDSFGTEISTGIYRKNI